MSCLCTFSLMCDIGETKGCSTAHLFLAKKCATQPCNCNLSTYLQAAAERGGEIRRCSREAHGGKTREEKIKKRRAGDILNALAREPNEGENGRWKGERGRRGNGADGKKKEQGKEETKEERRKWKGG